MSTCTDPGIAFEADAKYFVSVDPGRLRVGTTLRVPIFDERNVLLLAEGQIVTPTFLQKMRNRDVASVKVHERELSRVSSCEPQGTASSVPEDRAGVECQLRTEASERLDAEIRRGGQLGLPPQSEAFARDVRRHGADGYDEEDRDAFVECHAQSVEQMEVVFRELAAGRGLDLGTVGEVADSGLDQLVTDDDLFTCLGINPFPNKYPARHSLHTSMLAVAIGTHLGLDRPTLRELAIGCLVHDAGMLRIDARVYTSRRWIDPAAFLEVTKHPILVFDMMKEMRQLPPRAAFIAYQIHERCNGTGYPRQREGNQIHFLSKVAAVADVYVGLVSPRPHRPGMLPYRAVERLLHGTRQGLFDPLAVRGLLNTISLFPIGSFVQLNDGRIGRVLRANGQQYDRPTIQAWQPGVSPSQPTIVNLTERDDLSVVRALPHAELTAASTA